MFRPLVILGKPLLVSVCGKQCSVIRGHVQSLKKIWLKNYAYFCQS